MTAQIVLIIPILIRAVYTDIKLDIIENRLILAALLADTALNYVMGGTQAVCEGIKMAVIITGILFVLFIIKGLGAGDIKLLALTAMCFPEVAVRIVALSFILGGILSAARIILKAVRRERIIISGEKIHFSVPIAMGTIMAAVFGL